MLHCIECITSKPLFQCLILLGVKLLEQNCHSILMHIKVGEWQTAALMPNVNQYYRASAHLIRIALCYLLLAAC